jgi:hypothetical protein
VTKKNLTHPDPFWSDGLGNNDESLVGSPGNQDLGRGLVDFLGDLLDGRSVNDPWLAGNVVSKRRVGSDDDLFLLASSVSSSSRNSSSATKGGPTVLEQFGLDQGWMTLDLIHGRHHPSSLNDLLEHLNRKV